MFDTKGLVSFPMSQKNTLNLCMFKQMGPLLYKVKVKVLLFKSLQT